MILKIVTVPSSNLREKSKEIKKEEILKLKSLFLDMLETMKSADGLGLAAPQISKNIRLIAISKFSTSDKKNWILINPEIKRHSWRRIKNVEGCLSVPGVSREVRRYQSIEVKALNQDGREIRFKAENLLARVIQHEIDHLDGILIIDK